jgi:hypothetical protein
MNLYFDPRASRLMIEPRCYCGSKPTIEDPGLSAMEGGAADLAFYPQRAKINAKAQMGTGKFTGLGTADQNYKVSDQMAKVLLDIQQNYGADYIKQRLADLEQADPTGYAARKELFDRIIADADAQPNRPLAEDTQAQVLDILSRGSELSTGPGSQTEAVQQAVRGQQLANGIFLGNAPVSQEASAIVNAGDQAQTQRQSQAMGFLQSGVSPEDVEYRRVQQGLANLGAAIAGQTPEAQFSSLTGAQRLAAADQLPNVQNPRLNQNANIEGLQNAAQIYSGQVNWANSQANPWTVGISGLANAVGSANTLGLFNASTWGIGAGAPAGTTTTATASYAPGVNPYGL